jgi:hypothetical protein
MTGQLQELDSAFNGTDLIDIITMTPKTVDFMKYDVYFMDTYKFYSQANT